MPDESHKLAWVQTMRETRALTVKDLPGLRPSIAGPAPTATEMTDVDAILSKDGRCEAMTTALEAITARKSAKAITARKSAKAANNLSCKPSSQRPELVAELTSSMRERQKTRRWFVSWCAALHGH